MLYIITFYIEFFKKLNKPMKESICSIFQISFTREALKYTRRGLKANWKVAWALKALGFLSTLTLRH